MKENKEKRPVGRPKIEINWTEFDKLCGIQCTLREIAGYFECSEDTIENRCKEVHGINFSEYYAQKAGSGKISLRRKQFQVAMSGDKTMLIWLGKQYLKQAEKHEQSIDTSIKVNEIELDQDDINL